MALTFVVFTFLVFMSKRISDSQNFSIILNYRLALANTEHAHISSSLAEQTVYICKLNTLILSFLSTQEVHETIALKR